MDVKLTPAPPFDAIDRDEFKRMIESDMFKLILARIASERNRAVDACLREDSHVLVARAQGAALALATVLKLPEMILRDMTPNKPR